MDEANNARRKAPTLRRRILLLTAAFAIPAAAFQAYVAWRAYRGVPAEAVATAHERTRARNASPTRWRPLSSYRSPTTAIASP